MANFNKVILVGNLTRDPQVKFLPSGTPVAEFGMAVNRTWSDQATGEKKEAATFVDCRLMGKQAEVLSKYTRKGSNLFVEGRLEFRSWDAKDGTKRSKLDVYVENFQFLGSRRDDAGAEGEAPGGRRPENRYGGEAPRQGGRPRDAAEERPPIDDEVPF